MTLMDQLRALDRSVFLAINGWHSPWADVMMSTLSELLLWIPIYLLFLFLLHRRYGWKGLAWSVPVIALMIYGSDSGSVILFKNAVQRLRPCHVPELQGVVHVVDGYCGGSFGFVSSHASNHFAIASFMGSVLQGKPRWVWPALLLWASVIAYSRIYLGVHYPGDVVAGAAFGATVGCIASLIHKRLMMRLQIQPAL